MPAFMKHAFFATLMTPSFNHIMNINALIRSAIRLKILLVRINSAS